MKIGIMQPYFFPYVGYFQLMNAVDEFIVYDNIEYTKKGWINRNRILVNGKDMYITIPLKKDSDYLNVMDRSVADIWPIEKKKLLNRIVESYRKAPLFDVAYPVIEESIMFEEPNLFKYILNSLLIVRDYLQISSRLVVSSTILIDHGLKAEKKVIAICNARKATEYVNPIGGIQLYTKTNFKDAGIELYFLQASDIKYKQFDHDFIPSLSIIDVMMFNSREKIKELLGQYVLS